MTDQPTLQDRVAAWHTERFPDAQSYNVMLKATEELGEVAEALNGHLTGGRDGISASRAADVAVCMMVLLGRWFPDTDLIERVEAKLAVLTDPDSGHRSALRKP